MDNLKENFRTFNIAPKTYVMSALAGKNSISVLSTACDLSVYITVLILYCQTFIQNFNFKIKRDHQFFMICFYESVDERSLS